MSASTVAPKFMSIPRALQVSVHAFHAHLNHNVIVNTHPWCLFHYGKHVRVMYTPLNPILYSKTGVCRGPPIFLFFAPKHRLWVYPQFMFSAKIRKISKIF